MSSDIQISCCNYAFHLTSVPGKTHDSKTVIDFRASSASAEIYVESCEIGTFIRINLPTHNIPVADATITLHFSAQIEKPIMFINASVCTLRGTLILVYQGTPAQWLGLTTSSTLRKFFAP